MTDAKPDSRKVRRAVTVTIAGQDYRIVSGADEAWLQGVASGVDEAMALVRDRTETVDSLDVAVLTALNLARELVLLREQSGRPKVARGGAVSSDDIPLDPSRLEALIELTEHTLGIEPLA